MSFISLVFFITILIENLVNGYLEVLVNDNACYSGIDSTASTKFNAPYDGIIEGFKVVHKSGGIRWGGNCPFGNYGCAGAAEITTSLFDESNQILLYPTSDTLGVSKIYTLACNSCPVNTYEMSNIYTSDSDEIVIHSRLTHKQVYANTQYSLQYCESVCKNQHSDNGGYSCSEVYFLYTQYPTSSPTGVPITPTLEPPPLPPQQGCECNDGIKSCLELTGDEICSDCEKDNPNCKEVSHSERAIAQNADELGGCKQCKDGYFMKSKYYPCVSCKDTIEGCMQCMDYQGCIQCDDGYQYYWDHNCRLGKCMKVTDPNAANIQMV